MYPSYPANTLVAEAQIVSNLFTDRIVGFQSVFVAASTYLLTFGPNNQIDPSNATIRATVRGGDGVAAMITVTHTADTSILVSTFDEAGVAADADFYVSVHYKGQRF